MTRWLPLTAILLLAGCEAPAERPATPSDAPAPFAAPAPAYVGRWAADARACTAPAGDLQPIEITADRFEGYENSCAITAVREVDGAQVASLDCEAEGMRTDEQVRLAVRDDLLTLTYLEREDAEVQLERCPRAAG